MSRLLATFFFVGYLRPAPGTWGSLAALPLAWALHAAGGWPLLAVAILVLAVAGTRAIAAHSAARGEIDPPEIVVDEVVGQWVALLPVSVGAQLAGVPAAALWPGILVAVLAFRFFDIVKPGPVGRADRRGDPLGVMLDDVWAGALAALTVVVFALAAHWIVGR